MSDAPPRTSWLDAPFAQVDSAWAALVRIVLGASITYRAAWYLLTDYTDYLDTTHLRVPMYGFEWLPGSTASANAALFATLVAGALMTAGRAPRLMAAVCTACFSYFFLLDRTTFGNLDYVLCWALLWASLMPLGARASLDASARDEPPPSLMPAWHVWSLRAQLGVMYFYAGVVKLSPDWLSGRTYLANLDDGSTIFTELAAAPAAVALAAWGGALFDLLITPTLWWRRTRVLGVVALAVFHLTNALVLPLGILPYVLFGLTLAAFTSPERAATLLARFEQHPSEPRAARPVRRRLELALLALAATFHLLFPLRHLTYPGEGVWNGHGRDGAWWLRSFSLEANAKFTVRAEQDGQPVTEAVDVLSYIDAEQSSFALHPYTIVAFAHAVARDWRARGFERVRVHADISVSLDDHPFQTFVSPDVDLASVPLQRDMTHLVLPLERSTP